MKKFPLLISSVLLIVSFTYFSGNSNIYASIFPKSPSAILLSNANSDPKNLNKNKPRDFKMPDDSESENYNIHDVSSNDYKKTIPGNKGAWHGSKLVVIDPGHGGSDPGAVLGDLAEKNINLDVSLRLNKLLQDKGIETYITRVDDESVDLKERIFMANKLHAALFISIHSNWFADSSLNGTMTLYNPSESLCAGSLSELEFAQTIQNSLIASLGTKDKGIIDRPKLAVLNHAEMPSLIVELGFLSNKNDQSLLSSDNFRQKAADALAAGIKNSLDEISDSN